MVQGLGFRIYGSGLRVETIGSERAERRLEIRPLLRRPLLRVVGFGVGVTVENSGFRRKRAR